MGNLFEKETFCEIVIVEKRGGHMPTESSTVQKLFAVGDKVSFNAAPYATQHPEILTVKEVGPDGLGPEMLTLADERGVLVQVLDDGVICHLFTSDLVCAV